MFTSLTGLPACLALSSCRSVLNHAVFHIAALIATTARCVISRLRHFSAGSPQYPAETGSSSYGPTVRFRLLPTSSRDDAVTFGYGAVANSDRDLHPANSTLSRAYTETAVAAESELIKPFFLWRNNGRPAGNGWNSPVNNAKWGTDYVNRTGTAKSNMYDNLPTETK